MFGEEALFLSELGRVQLINLVQELLLISLSPAEG